MKLRLLASAVAASILLGACGSGSSVGKDIDLEKIKGKGGRAGITDKTTPSPTATATQPQQPTAPPTQATTAPPPPQVMQVFLLANNPYYQLEGSKPGGYIKVPAGVIVRFVSKESEFDRQPRVPDLGFECPRLKPGRSCELKAATPTGGPVTLEDGVRVFITGQLEIA